MQYRSRGRMLLEGVEGALVTFAMLCSWPVAKRRFNNWGATREERSRTWPGDSLATPNLTAHTRAVDIAAPACSVWPWLVQFGWGRAGFYSYELLERLVGIAVTNLESIEPAFQSLAVGDVILLHPKAPGIPVGLLQPGQHICFGETFATDRQKPNLVRSWSIYLEPVSDASCRLLVRGCFEQVRPQSLAQRATLAVEEPIDFVMEQRMLRTIKRLAEASPSLGPAAPNVDASK